MNHAAAIAKSGRRPARRIMIGLLAALAITLAGVATPLAGTAHAGGKGGIGGDVCFCTSRPPLTQPN